ncbi:MAG TPA: DUF799 family lipoprotein [Smithellaceae bacterium]|nr:DUF799 family lipoprotein [Smithellaceae bacterium]
MRSGFKRLPLLVVFFSALLLQSCLFATKTTVIAPEIRSFFEGTYAVDPEMKASMPRTVAVLPFVNLSEKKEAVDVLRRGFYNHFSSLPFADMELYRVDELLARAGLSDPDLASRTPPQKLGEILGVDAIVTGEISNFDKFFAVLYSQVAVGADVKMVSTKSGRLLWSGSHTVRKHEGGFSTHPVGIAAVVLVTALNMRDIQLLRANDDLFRDMVKTIPTPALADVSRPPGIALLTHDTLGLPKKAGDEIKVVIQGTPKMRAWFDIGEAKKHIDMQEVEPGVYLGVYKVLPGDNVENALLTGYLRDDAGNTGHWVDALRGITLDTTAPDSPGRVRALGRDRAVELRWEKAVASDLAGYVIYRSETPLSGYVPIGRTELNEYRDAADGLVNLKPYYYRIASADFAGNESAAVSAQGMPVAPGPTAVSGALQSDTTWHAGASPYILEGDVTVKDRAHLVIEPGAVIRSKGGALIIEGRLTARGDSENLIEFSSAQTGAFWPGIVFANVRDRDNALAFVRIEAARAAVTCRASSPRIESSEFVRNEKALVVEGAFSRPVVVGNTLHRNTGPAVTATEGSAPSIENNTVCDNGGAGIILESAAADMSGNLIARNRQNGLLVKGSRGFLRGNRLTGNEPWNLFADLRDEAFDASGNWWGSDDIASALATVSGRVEISSIARTPDGEGGAKTVNVLPRELGGRIDQDAYLLTSRSPYRVTSDMTIGNGATLFIQPGVELSYDPKTSLVVEDGGVIARGRENHPIVFTAASASPSPGFYTSAAKFVQASPTASAFVYCDVRYAAIAFDIGAGSPDISRSRVAYSSQSAVYCRREASPVLSFNTFEQNRGEGAVVAVGMANPKIFRNNFVNNEISVSSFSTISIDARNNWWGASPPPAAAVWGDNVNIHPWLEREETGAFRPKP